MTRRVGGKVVHPDPVHPDEGGPDSYSTHTYTTHPQIHYRTQVVLSVYSCRPGTWNPNRCRPPPLSITLLFVNGRRSPPEQTQGPFRTLRSLFSHPDSTSVPTLHSVFTPFLLSTGSVSLPVSPHTTLCVRLVQLLVPEDISVGGRTIHWNRRLKIIGSFPPVGHTRIPWKGGSPEVQG